MLALNVFCHLWTTCKMSTFIKLDITFLRNDQFVSFLFCNKQKRVLVKYMLNWTFEYHLFVFKNIINPGQLLFDSRCIDIILYLITLAFLALVSLKNYFPSLAAGFVRVGHTFCLYQQDLPTFYQFMILFDFSCYGTPYSKIPDRTQSCKYLEIVIL